MSDLEKKLGGIPDQVRIQKIPPVKEKVHTSDSIPVQPEPQVSGKSEKEHNTDTKKPVDAFSHNDMKEWAKVLEYLRSTGNMKMYVYLQDTRCILVDGSTAVVVIGSDEQFKRISCAGVKALRLWEALLKVTGISMTVKVKDEAEMGLIEQDASGSDPVLEKVKQFAMDNGLKLDITE